MCAPEKYQNEFGSFFFDEFYIYKIISKFLAFAKNDTINVNSFATKLFENIIKAYFLAKKNTDPEADNWDLEDIPQELKGALPTGDWVHVAAV